MAAISWFITRKKEVVLPERVRPIGLCITLLLTALTTGAARYFNQNEILLARLQLQQQQQDWETMIETARSARQPSRAVAAYHAVALEETDQLLMVCSNSYTNTRKHDLTPLMATKSMDSSWPTATIMQDY